MSETGARKWVITITVILASLLELIDTTVVNVSLPQIMGNLGATLEDVLEAQEPDANKQYVAGVDVASSIDFTVVSVMDVQEKALVYMDRFNRVDYNVLENRLESLYRRWHLDSMKVEANSIGQPVIDHLYSKGLSIIPFTTTSATKQSIIQNLQSAFEHGEIRIINDPVLVGELLSFESKRSPSGGFSYSAPSGMHDDTVMSLAIAWSAIAGDVWFFSSYE